eukprot:2821060-Rhodomonas_salina.2
MTRRGSLFVGPKVIAFIHARRLCNLAGKVQDERMRLTSCPSHQCDPVMTVASFEPHPAGLLSSGATQQGEDRR